LEATHEHLITASRDCSIKVWGVDLGTLFFTLTGHTRPVRALHVTGNRVVSGGDDHKMRIWSLDDGEELYNGGEGVQPIHAHEGQVTCIGMVMDKVVTGSVDGTLKFWDFSRIDPSSPAPSAASTPRVVSPKSTVKKR